MKKLIFILIITPLIISHTVFSQQDSSVKIVELKPYALKFFDLLKEDDYKNLYAMFDSTAQKQLTENQLATVSKMMALQFGNYIDTLDFKYSKVLNFDALEVKYDFERAVITFRFTFDEKKKLRGFFITSRNEKNFYTAPDYVDTTLFTEKDIKFGVVGWKLPGVLSIPKGIGPFPVLILVHGSGPNDKDETIGPNKPFRDLAWGLASKGIAVFRYDKRTKAHGLDFMKKIQNYTIKDEVIEDVLKAVDTLETINSINPKLIFVLGHSLGGYALPKIAEGRNDIKGLIIMAGSTRKLEDVILDQSKYLLSLDTVNSAEKKVYLDSIEAQVKRVKEDSLSMDTPSTSLPLNISPAYWLDLRNYSPANLAKTLKMPMLIIQGQRDYQVTMADYNIWKKELSSKKNVKFKLYPKLNHLFMEGEGKSKPAEYNTLGHIPVYVIKDIADWMKKIK